MGSQLPDDSLLVVVMDMSPQLALIEDGPTVFIKSVLAFCNFHIASASHNKIALVAANHHESRFFYPSHCKSQVSPNNDGRLETLDMMNQNILSELLAMLESSERVIGTESLLAGAIGRGLLFIKRHITADITGRKYQSRLLVVKSSSDNGGQYLNYINMFLTAQKIGTTLDACVVGSDCGLLQQGADITGGYYYKVEQMDHLLQVMTTLYLPTITTRKLLSYPPPTSVDYRAACFCHKNLVDMAHVCSNCLSVYCKTVPLCSTCNVFFKNEMPLRKGAKRKK